MAKETYYFSHDYNARNDKKISALVREFKSSGYGIFWATCEMMHEEGGSIEFDNLTIQAISKDMNETEDFIRLVLNECVDKFKLFTKQNEAEISGASLLRSSRIHRNLDEKNKKKQTKQEAGRLGGISSGITRSYKNKAEAKRSIASSNEPKESKVKESKIINTIKKGFNTNPIKTDFNGIPQQYIDKSIELIFYSTQKKVPPDSIKGMWDIFKVQNLTGENFYQNEGKVFSHFLNWIKTQKIDTSTKGNLQNMNNFI